ncbi:MAG: SH3 domain-containing protein [Cyanobacteria bacterium P01_B01_bin.77]
MTIKWFVLSVPLVLGSLALKPLPAQAGCSSYGSIGVSCSTPRYNTPRYNYDFKLDTYSGRNYWELPWYDSPNGRGWVSPSPTFTVSDPDKLSSSVAFPVTEGMSAVVNTVNGGFLNVRSDAGLESPVTYVLSNPVEVTLSGETEEGWVQINDGGWVHSDYLKPM